MKMRLHVSRKTGAAVLLLVSMTAIYSCHFEKEKPTQSVATLAHNWFPYFDFDPATFQKAPREFGPYTRWWWPGNDVTAEELQREIKLLADNGFAGVEIQPLTVGTNFNAAKETADKIYSWDTPSFYEHVKAVMEQAKVSGITVDLNGGSGWPLSSPTVKPAESMRSLLATDTTVAGGHLLNITVPKRLPDISKLPSLGGMTMFREISPSLATLQAVVAARVVKQEATQTILDPETLADITSQVKNGTLNWTVPAGGEWKIIAFWSVPDGEKPALIATKQDSYVPDHLDSTQLIKVYDYLFGQRTGLDKYYGHPFRAIFNDSYEFKPDRHFSQNFLAYFKAHRGYDIRPLLPANIQRGYNNAFASFLMPGQKPLYILSAEDWRLRYDYDQTVGDLVREQFIGSSNRWMQERGIIHRTQAYGVKMDVIAASGLAAIPEAEQLFAEGSEGFIKLVTSGAHLYNKPVIAQESVVFSGRAEMTTPQKIRMLADKSMTAGINQFVYHGTPYKYQTGEYGREGWNAWSSPLMPMFNFSSDINESYPFWNNIKTVNEYIARAQYAMRSGKPRTDVLIYFPFVDFGEGNITTNPEELLAKGELKDVEPETQGMSLRTDHTNNKTTLQQWYSELWPVVNALNAAGITWEFVNDESLLLADTQHNQVHIRGNAYQAILLPNEPYVQLPTAAKLKDLSTKGAKVLITGKIPDKQPGYLNYKANDAQTKQLLAATGQHIADATQLDSWISTLTKDIKFSRKYPSTRIIDRDMKDGSRLEFIWNQSGEWQTIALTASTAYKHFYWLDPTTGNIVKNESSTLSYNIPPYSAILLYAAKEKMNEPLLSAPAPAVQSATVAAKVDAWDVKAGDAVAGKIALFDWRTNAPFKFKSGEGIYTTVFQLNKQPGKKYMLDLGTVYFTATVSINGKFAGTALWAPYQLPITDQLQSGNNTIEVRVMTTNRNEFIGEMVNGNPKYQQFKGKENTLMPAGLIGPVSVKEMK